jgi:hypothetical protein
MYLEACHRLLTVDEMFSIQTRGPAVTGVDCSEEPIAQTSYVTGIAFLPETGNDRRLYAPATIERGPLMSTFDSFFKAVGPAQKSASRLTVTR